MEEIAPNGYSAPVDKLLTLGEVQQRDPERWFDYKSLSIGPEHIPDLLRMATDMELNNADSESDEVWGPLHAWRALGQLQAVQTIETLINQQEQLENDEWIIEELPEVFGVMGPSALPTLIAYSADTSRDNSLRITAISGIEIIGKRWPQVRNESVEIITRQLEKFKKNDGELNAFLIVSLINLQATKAIPVIERAFAANRVDTTIVGNWDDVQAEFGLISQEELVLRRVVARSQPSFQPRITGMSPPTSFSGKSKGQGSHKKSKNKKRKR